MQARRVSAERAFREAAVADGRPYAFERHMPAQGPVSKLGAAALDGSGSRQADSCSPRRSFYEGPSLAGANRVMDVDECTC